jgi:cytochrome c peroxidase
LEIARTARTKIRVFFVIVLACVALNAARAEDALPPPAYEWRLPPGFPRPVVPADNPMSSSKRELGRRLFHDTRLSSTGQYACASCHRPELAFTDGRPRAVGATGKTLKRGSMSLANVAYNPAYTWGDARVRTLESQMRLPLFNEHPVEMGLKGDARLAVERLSGDTTYRDLFTAAFPDDAAPVSIDHVITAIATFERTLVSGRSPFDRYVFDDERAALSDAAKRGMALFFSARVGCAQCHAGLNFSGPVVYEGHQQARALFANTGLYDVDGRGGYPRSDRGLMDVSHRAADMGKFRVPTLRNVALTAPYMHDGSLPDLDAVIDHYARGGRRCSRAHCVAARQAGAHQDFRRDPRIRPFALSQAERADLLAFLGSLTDREFVEDPRFRRD